MRREMLHIGHDKKACCTHNLKHVHNEQGHTLERSHGMRSGTHSHFEPATVVFDPCANIGTPKASA